MGEIILLSAWNVRRPPIILHEPHHRSYNSGLHRPGAQKLELGSTIEVLIQFLKIQDKWKRPAGRARPTKDTRLVSSESANLTTVELT